MCSNGYYACYKNTGETQYDFKLIITVRLFASSNLGSDLLLGVIGDNSWCEVTGMHISADYYLKPTSLCIVLSLFSYQQREASLRGKFSLHWRPFLVGSYFCVLFGRNLNGP